MSDNSRHRKREGSQDSSRHRVRQSEDGTKPTRYYSKKQETKVASDLNGQRQKNSGATMWDKGDIILDQFLMECKTKTTHCESMSIKKEWLEKNAEEALFIGKPYNALVFNFGPDEDNYYIIDKYLFQELVQYLKEKQEEENK